jgi:pimeloyl-ACP methyl ester carboxylesterase
MRAGHSENVRRAIDQGGGERLAAETANVDAFLFADVDGVEAWGLSPNGMNAGRSDLDADRVALHGGSTGGYWATKVAHTHAHRLRGAVNQGGPAHFAFQKHWIVTAQRGEYPFELAETLACAFGGTSADDWIGYAPKLSLLDQGILDQPCAPLLCVNGVQDSVFPIADMYLLLEHGAPKSARFYPDGHMGGGNSREVIIAWLKHRLRA